jgi:branched-chain amino acid transport system ATP-binding protein
MLEIEHLEVAYGEATAVRDVSLRVDKGEIVTLIGGNGAGKTTTLRAISGLLPLRAGHIEFEGARLDGLGSSQIVARGIGHVPEGRQLFPTMTVRENLELGDRGTDLQRRADALDFVFALFPRLRERERQLAGTLSGGEQQMCAIGRGLMARPRLLLLDEPSLGLVPLTVKVILDTLRRVNGAGTTILLVEQNVPRALELSHRGYVLENGRIVLEGTRESLMASPPRQAGLPRSLSGHRGPAVFAPPAPTGLGAILWGLDPRRWSGSP